MRCAVVITLLSCLPLSAAVADVYRSVDAQGHVQYSDTPTPGAELVHSTGPRFASTTLSVTATQSDAGAAKPGASSTKKSDEQVRDELNKEAQRQQVNNDVSDARAEQCKKAREDYQGKIQARRIFTVDSNGQRQYMSDADADQARLEAKQQVDELCK